MYRNTIRVVSFRTRTIYDNPRLYRRITTSPRVLSSDPWPLPHSPEHLSSTTTPPTRTQIPPLPRHNEDEGTIRARLVYQSRKRGTLESDLLLSTFAKEYLDDMSLDELREYDKLLDEQDWDIYYWATNNRSPPERWAKSSLLEKLKVHAKNEGKVTRKMPSL